MRWCVAALHLSSPMRISLSSADLTRLEVVLQTLLSPLAHPSVAAWRTSVSRSVKDLFQADKAACILGMEGEDFLVGADVDMAGFRAYQDYYWKLDVGYQQRRRALGLEVNNLAMVYDIATLGTTEVYNDFSRRYGFLDALAASTDLDASSAPGGIVVYHDHEAGAEFGERGVALMHLLLPALKSGITMCVRFAHRRAALAQFLDTLPGGCLAVDMANVVVHQSRGLDALLAHDPERNRVAVELRQLAASLAAGLRSRATIGRLDGSLQSARLLRTGHARYQCRGSYLGGGAGDPDALVLVTIDRVAVAPPTDAELRRKFGLTPRETEVARLLEQGCTNRGIAATLGFSIHTAERHTERVLAKMGLHSRAAVAATLMAPDNDERPPVP